MGVDVTHAEDRARFVVELDGDEEAYLSYEETEEGRLDLLHTFVPEEHRGRGIAEAIVLEALEHAREAGRSIVPTCPYVRHVVEDVHPEYASLVAPGDDATSD